MHQESLEDPSAFWGRIADELPWIARYKQVLDWSAKPFVRWFVEGKLNASAVCVDQHLTTARKDKVAILDAVGSQLVGQAKFNQ